MVVREPTASVFLSDGVKATPSGCRWGLTGFSPGACGLEYSRCCNCGAMQLGGRVIMTSSC